MKKVVLFVSLCIVLMLVGVGLWAYFAFLYTKPLSKSELAELTPDWSVVTHGNWSPWFTEADGTQIWNPAASFNAWLATVPEEDKAWPVLVDVYYRNQTLFNERQTQRPVADVEDWESLSLLLATDQSKDAIEAIVNALGRGVMGCGLYESTDPYEHRAMLANGIEDDDWQENPELNPGLMTLFPPSARVQHKTVRLVLLNAASSLTQGDTDTFVDQVAVVMHSSRLSSEYPTLINQLGTLSAINSSLRTISWAIENHSDQFNEAHLVALDNAIEQTPTPEFLWQGEAIAFHDTLRRMASTNGELSLQSASSWGGGNGALDDPIALPDLKLHKSLQRILFVYGELLEESATQSKIPWDGSWGGSDALYEKYKGGLGAPGSLLIDVLLPALDKTAIVFRESAQQGIALRLAIAIRRHELLHGSYPVSLEAIETDFLSFEPMDVFTGKKLHYYLGDLGPTIYSVGPDRDDDGGEHVFGIARESSKKDGDWVLYPTPHYPEDD